MESSWEALDIDDSDIPSLLRPCKKRLNNQTSPPPIRPPPSPQLDSLPIVLIPGPAGAVQLAMLRKKYNSHITSDEAPMSTQDYLTKAVHDAEEDQDFKRTPWIHATQFLTNTGQTCTPLSSLKTFPKSGKVDQVIVVIKSSEPNGLGDLTVTLKDLTATIGGSIHRKILAHTEYAKDISAGAILILRNVTVFAPSRTARYLNVTLKNVFKVFCKDNGPQLIKNYFASTVKYAAPVTDCGEKTRMLQKPCSQEQTEITMNDIGHNAYSGESLHTNQKVKRNSTEISGDNQVVVLGENNNGSKVFCKDSRPQSIKNYFASAAKHAAPHTDYGEKLRMSQKPCSQEQTEVNMNDFAQNAYSEGSSHTNQKVKENSIEIGDDNQVVVLEANDKESKESNLPHLQGSLHCSGISVNFGEDKTYEETQRIGGVDKQRHPLISRTSVPEWTDEQLNELFDMGFDDF